VSRHGAVGDPKAADELTAFIGGTRTSNKIGF